MHPKANVQCHSCNAPELSLELRLVVVASTRDPFQERDTIDGATLGARVSFHNNDTGLPPVRFVIGVEKTAMVEFGGLIGAVGAGRMINAATGLVDTTGTGVVDSVTGSGSDGITEARELEGIGVGSSMGATGTVSEAVTGAGLEGLLSDGSEGLSGVLLEGVP